MKNVFAGVLISALCAGLVACNEPVGQGQNEEGTEIQPVPVNEISAEVAAFFDENVALIGRAVFYKYNNLETREFVDACVAINSVEEFEQIDFRGETPPELPAIDFNSHTLVIGQWVQGHPGIFLESQKVIVKDSVATIELYLGQKSGEWEQRVDIGSFWGLYPKLTNLPINVVRQERTSNPDLC